LRDTFAVTERHYAQGSVVKNAATARVLERLDQAGNSVGTSAREQLEQLDENTLVQLLALLAESKKAGSPAN
jgi:hypothetical protein